MVKALQLVLIYGIVRTVSVVYTSSSNHMELLIHGFPLVVLGPGRAVKLHFYRTRTKKFPPRVFGHKS